jgi:hypothetical protein
VSGSSDCWQSGAGAGGWHSIVDGDDDDGASDMTLWSY